MCYIDTELKMEVSNQNIQKNNKLRETWVLRWHYFFSKSMRGESENFFIQFSCFESSKNREKNNNSEKRVCSTTLNLGILWLTPF